MEMSMEAEYPITTANIMVPFYSCQAVLRSLYLISFIDYNSPFGKYYCISLTSQMGRNGFKSV